MKKEGKKSRHFLKKLFGDTFDSIVGIFSLEKHFPNLNRSEMRRICDTFADVNYNRLPAMASLGFIFAVIFIIGDINADFYRQNYPVSILNIIFESLYLWVGLAVVVMIGILHFRGSKVSPKFKVGIHTFFYACASVASGLGYVSEGVRGQRSIVPMFFIIYFGTITTMPLGLFFFCYAAVFLPALITQGIIGTFEAAELLTAIASGLFFFFNRTIYLRFRITQSELEKANEELTRITVTDPLTKAGKGAMHEYVTLSYGAYISRFDEDFVLEEKTRLADEQLYISKKNGRDRITVISA